MIPQLFQILRSVGILSIVGLIFFASIQVTQADDTGTVGVGFTVGTENNSSSVLPPPPPPPDSYPTIGSVVKEISFTSAVISWQASDDGGSLTANSFAFGLTGYTQAVAVSGTYPTYSVALSGLQSDTTYLFKITATDKVGHVAEQTGPSFKTLSMDIVAPIISAVSVTASTTAATITWTTNEAADAQFKYGLTAAYGITESVAEFGTTHSQNLSNLSPNTIYHYKIIATDAAGNTSATADSTFTTEADVTPPADVSGLTVVAITTPNSLLLDWVNPPDVDFASVRLARKINSHSSSRTDGDFFATVTQNSFTDTNIVPGTLYFYTLFSLDTSGNYSGGTFASGQITAPTEICSNNIDDDRNNKIDCADAACSSFPTCHPAEICDNTLDDDNNGKTDCSDSTCSNFVGCSSKPIVEICANGSDDDGNGKIDCADTACRSFPSCLGSALPVDSAVSSATSTDSVTATSTIATSTVPEFSRVPLSKLNFFAGARRIPLTPTDQNITLLSGANFTIGAPQDALAGTPNSIVFKLDTGETHQFNFNSSNNNYFADSAFPGLGAHEGYVIIDYGQNQIDSIRSNFIGLPSGLITADGALLSDATVTLYDDANKRFATEIYGLSNPIITNANGTYGFVVPNGRYHLEITKAKYFTRRTPVFTVANNVINSSWDLIAEPLPTISSQTKARLKQGLQTIEDSAKVFQEFKADKEVQQAASDVVAPAVVSVAAVGTVALVSWTSLLPFLRFLFLQPLMLLGLRRRTGWGQIYNTLSKMPVDLATVRLLNATTGKVIQSKVTDKQGRYAFVVAPGNYLIQVVKAGFTFPSALLTTAKVDGRRPDIYHGEPIVVSDTDVVITANIPLDPLGDHKKPVRVFWQQLARFVQVTLSWLGLVITAFSLYISPRWYVWALLGLHILLVAIFRRLAIPPKVKSWGIVYDAGTKKPVGRTVARLFNAEFNKLVATQITDGRGRYYFLAGDDKYYVTYDHPEYNAHKTETLDLSGKVADTISVDVGLNKPIPTTADSKIPNT